MSMDGVDIDDVRDDILDAIDGVLEDDYDIDAVVTMGDGTSHQLAFIVTFAEDAFEED
jgi:hypothetical protein